MRLIYLGFFYSVEVGGGWGKEAEATTAAKSAQVPSLQELGGKLHAVLALWRVVLQLAVVQLVQAEHGGTYDTLGLAVRPSG